MELSAAERRHPGLAAARGVYDNLLGVVLNKANVKGLKLAYAVPLGGGAGNEFANATPLVEDGFLYVTDSWGVLYKIDGTSGDAGRIVWRMDPKQERQATNRGAAFWGIWSSRPPIGLPRILATDKDSGKVVWEQCLSMASLNCA